MSKRYESGHEKRKRKRETMELVNKIPKLTAYFQSNHPNKEIANDTLNDNNDGETSSKISSPHDNAEGTSTLPPALSIDLDLDSAPHNKNGTDILHKDPALWPIKLYENEKEREKYLNKGYLFFQNKNSSFTCSKRVYKKQNRYFSPNYFEKDLNNKNGEKCDRTWLMFSESTGTVFCYVCKLFSSDQNTAFVNGGFSNWKKTDQVICGHENSKEHNRCMLNWINYMNKSSHIDKDMVEKMENEINYWTEVLRRVVAVIKFLCERGHPFRGSDEVIGSKQNGNFLGVLELVAEFDPFLKHHIDNYAHKGRGSVSYLSKTICEEIIELMAHKIMMHIIQEIKEAKYWGLVVDSTPDIAHVDQLSVVFRYYLNGHVHERFFDFLQIKSHTGAYLSVEILKLLETHTIDIADCRAQTYDNASNMSGKYSGLQALLRQRNDLAFYVPCVGHSLNLIGECSVDECLHSVNFFAHLKCLYAFFSASTIRWGILTSKNGMLKGLCFTRWECRVNASKDYVNHFNEIHESLSELSEDDNQKWDARHEAESLMGSMIKLENVFMAVFWHRILGRFHAVSQFVQKVEVDLDTANNMLLSLLDYVKGLRDQFSQIENETKNLSPLVKQDYSDVGRRKIVRRLCDGETQEETLNASDKFRINTFYVIIDKIVAELTKRSEAYSYITGLFGFLSKLLVMKMDEVHSRAHNLIEVYSRDLEDRLVDELEQFIPMLKCQPQGYFSARMDKENKVEDNRLYPLKVLNWIVASNMIDVFPNVYIAYRLFLTTPIANCEAERSFSVLSRIRNVQRANMRNERVSSLSRLAIETDLLRSLNFDDIIDQFAQAKGRKKLF